jgi:hypothetical protein
MGPAAPHRSHPVVETRQFKFFPLQRRTASRLRSGGAVSPASPYSISGSTTFRLDALALAAREITAVQLGPELLDVVGERNHRPLHLLQKAGTALHAGSRRVKDAEGAAEQGEREPILSGALDNRRASARSFRSANWGDRASLARPGSAWRD